MTQDRTMGAAPAASAEELEEAYRLVYRTYRPDELIESHPSHMHLSLFQALPNAATFVGHVGNDLAGTVSIVPDTDMGLPMDEIYEQELADLRDDGQTIAEVTKLGDRRRNIHRRLPLLTKLMKLILDYARFMLHADELCIAVHPHHQGFYEKYLFFSPLGGEQSYPSLQDNPAVALHLNLEEARHKCREHPSLWDRFFADSTPKELFEDRYKLTPEALKDLFLVKRPLLTEASQHTVDILREQYKQKRNWTDETWKSILAPAATGANSDTRPCVR